MDTGGAASPPPQGQCPVMPPSGHHGSPRADSWLDPAPGPGLGVRVCPGWGRPAAGQPTLRGLTCPLGTFLPASGLGRVVMSHSPPCRPPCLRSVLASARPLPPLLPCGFGLVSVLLHLCVAVSLSPLFLCAPLPGGINSRCAGVPGKGAFPSVSSSQPSPPPPCGCILFREINSVRSALQEFGRGYTFPRAPKAWGQEAGWLKHVRSTALVSCGRREGPCLGLSRAG